MGNRHRSRHPPGGRDDPPGVSGGEPTLVLPGEELPASGLRPGPGTYRVNGRVYASVLGLLRRRPPMVHVVPLSGRYIPQADDVVIGTVTDVQGTFWLLDIGAPRWAPLHMTGTPWKIDYGETERYLRVGDCVIVRVESIENTGRIGVTMNGEGLGKVEGGTLVTVSPAKVPRVIGRGGSMIQMIQRMTGCRLVVGQNGRIYVDGPAEATQRVRETLELIDAEGHRTGLTERVEGFLSATADRDEAGRTRAPEDPWRTMTAEPPLSAPGPGPDQPSDAEGEDGPPEP